LIAALLAESSVSAAAKAANCSRRTAHRWLEQPAFQAALRAARQGVVDGATRLIQSASGEAVAALRGILQDAAAPAYSRVAAARFLVDSALRIREMEELQDRIEVLEERLGQREEAERLRTEAAY
jgi:hypothetical protein